MDMYKDIHEHFDCVEIKFCSMVQLAIAASIWSGDALFVKQTCLQTNIQRDLTYWTNFL